MGETTILENIRWDTYECLLRDFEESGGSRLTYDHGRLEIMSPLFAHEEDNRTLARIVETLAEEWGVNLRNAGALTLKREDQQRGLEPDSSFYIQSLSRIAGQRRIDLAAGDPVPDLVIEVDVTSPSLDKLTIYAALGIPEVWLLRQDSVTLFALSEGTYQEHEQSIAFPRLTASVLNDFLSRSRTELYLNWLRVLREWARQTP